MCVVLSADWVLYVCCSRASGPSLHSDDGTTVESVAAYFATCARPIGPSKLPLANVFKLMRLEAKRPLCVCVRESRFLFRLTPPPRAHRRPRLICTFAM
jgi:hypothetical protein